MSVKIDIDLTDHATPELRQLIADVEPGGELGKVMGRALATTLRTHFRQRNAKGNALGGKRSHFWSRIANAVQAPQVSQAEISVTVSDRAIAQKIFGGRIVPTNAKALAIPADKKAYGKSPRTIADLAFIPARGGPQVTIGYLVEGKAGIISRGPRKGEATIRPLKGGVLMYVLRAWVDQAPDPEALPQTPAMLEAVTTAARTFLHRP